MYLLFPFVLCTHTDAHTHTHRDVELYYIDRDRVIILNFFIYIYNTSIYISI